VGAIRPGDGALAARVATRFLDAERAQIERNRPMLARLSARYHLGIVSNFYGNLPAVCANLHIRSFFRVIVDSTQVGISKPDPRIFLRAVEELGVPLADAVFVGDSPARDMAGARGVGMRHIWVAGEEAQHAEPCCPGDRVVRSLEEVEALL
jgi:putative hydrolase of the HAD superfamily